MSASLLAAVLAQDIPTLERTLATGNVHIDTRDSACRTALHHAAVLALPRSVAALLHRGATVSVRDDAGRTPFQSTCFSQRFHAGIASTLLSHATPAQAATDLSILPHVCAELSGIQRLDEGVLTVIRFLLHAGSHVNATDARGATPLMHVVRFTHVEGVYADLVGGLIQAGADVNAHDACGISVLRHAALAYSDVGVAMLLAAGAVIQPADMLRVPAVSRGKGAVAAVRDGARYMPMLLPPLGAVYSKGGAVVGVGCGGGGERMDVSLLQALRTSSRDWRTGAYEAMSERERELPPRQQQRGAMMEVAQEGGDGEQHELAEALAAVEAAQAAEAAAQEAAAAAAAAESAVVVARAAASVRVHDLMLRTIVWRRRRTVIVAYRTAVAAARAAVARRRGGVVSSVGTG